jgi:hypothetical protein
MHYDHVILDGDAENGPSGLIGPAAAARDALAEQIRFLAQQPDAQLDRYAADPQELEHLAGYGFTPPTPEQIRYFKAVRRVFQAELDALGDFTGRLEALQAASERTRQEKDRLAHDKEQLTREVGLKAEADEQRRYVRGLEERTVDRTLPALLEALDAELRREFVQHYYRRPAAVDPPGSRAVDGFNWAEAWQAAYLTRVILGFRYEDIENNRDLSGLIQATLRAFRAALLERGFPAYWEKFKYRQARTRRWEV